jgi:hypothetical protein
MAIQMLRGTSFVGIDLLPPDVFDRHGTEGLQWRFTQIIQYPLLNEAFSIYGKPNTK